MRGHKRLKPLSAHLFLIHRCPTTEKIAIFSRWADVFFQKVGQRVLVMW